MLSAVVVLACSGCHATPKRPVGVRLTPVPAASLGLPSGVRAEAAFRLPADLRPWTYGIRAGRHHLAFGVVPPGLDPNKGEQPADQFGRYAVVDTASGSVSFGQTVRRGAYSDVDALFPVGDADYLVRVESRPELDPATACPTDPRFCWSWAVYGRRLPDGPEVELDRGAKADEQSRASRPEKAAMLKRLTDIYDLAWLDDETLELITPDGAELYSTQRAAQALFVSPFTRANVDDGTLAFEEDVAGDKVAVVARTVR